MERQVYLYPNSVTHGAQTLRLRDDGTFSVEAASSPPAPHLILIGTSRGIACFLDAANHQFVLWHVKDGTPKLRIRYDPTDLVGHESVACFGHTAQRDIKIVRLASRGASYALQVQTTAVTFNGAVAGGVLGPGGVFQADGTWGEWLVPDIARSIMPDRNQPARFSGEMAYWQAFVARRPRIITFNVRTNEMGTLHLPNIEFTNRARFGLGFADDGELAVALFSPPTPAEASNLRVWRHINGHWDLFLFTDIYTAPAPATVYPYLPLCVFHCRNDDVGVMHVILLCNGSKVIRVKANAVNLLGVESLHSMPKVVTTSLLPPSVYVDVLETNRPIGDGGLRQPRQRNVDWWQRNFQENVLDQALDD